MENPYMYYYMCVDIDLIDFFTNIEKNIANDRKQQKIEEKERGDVEAANFFDVNTNRKRYEDEEEEEEEEI
jgi:hypothetical protein